MVVNNAKNIGGDIGTDIWNIRKDFLVLGGRGTPDQVLEGQVTRIHRPPQRGIEAW